MEEKKCKQCAMMIPEEAKVCPHCRKKQPSKAVPWLLLIIVLLFGYTCSHMPSTQAPITSSSHVTPEVVLTAKGQKVKAKNANWSNEICNEVGDKRIQMGMSPGQVRASWGKPDKINSTTTQNGTHEQWVYGDLQATYLYLDNGRVTSWQASR